MENTEKQQNNQKYKKQLALFIQFSALLLLWLPNTLTPFEPTEAGHIRYLEAIGLGSIFWIMVAALCGSSKRLLLISIPLAMLLPVELWTRIYYGTPINEHIIALAWESNIAESTNLLKTYGSTITPLCAIFILFSLALRSTGKINIYWHHKSRYWFIAIFLPFLFIFSWVKQDIDPLHPQEITPPSYFDDEFKGSWLAQWSDVFPMNLLYFGERFIAQHKKMTDARKTLIGKSLGAWQDDLPSSPDIAIVVIGESASASHWGIFGYSRETTPALQKRDGIAFFSDVVSLSSATRTAIPGVLSRRPLLTPGNSIDWNAEPSFLKAFSEVEYSTHWISNQAPLGQHDTSISVYAKDASDVRFLNPGTYAGRSNHDEVLLKPLEDILALPGRHIIVLHLLGSHFEYELRYPEEFNKFKSEILSNKDDEISEKQSNDINHYDNSIFYTNYILDQVIELTQKTKKKSIVAYFSDHGVDLPQGRCKAKGASRVSETSFHVPAFLWSSQEFRDQNNDQWSRILKNTEQPYSTKAVFSTILDLSGIQIKDGLPNESFLTTPIKENRRIIAVSSGKLIDFDLAKKTNPCLLASN